MEIRKENPNIFKPSKEIRDLQLLEEFEKNPLTSQRELSHKFNIALGVINACIKRMVRKGWIRIRGFNRRKIGYYLTPKGFTEKARLSIHLISCTIQHYVELKKIITQRLLEMEKLGVRRLVFFGVGDEMEVAYITLQGVNMKLVGIVEDDEKYKPNNIFGLKIEPISRLEEMNPDGILITSTLETEGRKERVKKIFESKPICIKDISFS